MRAARDWTRPTVWPNPNRRPAGEVLPGLPVTAADLADAVARWRRFAPLLGELFPGRVGDGGIDSPLLDPPATFADALLAGRPGRVLVKADHQLPVTGSIKARGGVYEVLAHAERLALDLGALRPDGDRRVLAGAACRAEFGRRVVMVGSTGNLGFSVGTIGRALGFSVEIHMSADAKAWKKDRLRRLGATVVEHAADYAVAVARARRAAAGRSDAYFVDDENSVHLFLGYAAGAHDLRDQFLARGIVVDRMHPLVVYLPCGVGGAPGGIAFGLKHIFGDAARCVFVEPVEAACMLVQLAHGPGRPVSVYDVGLRNRTAADGLAVPAASMLVAKMMDRLVDAVATVADPDLFHWARRAWEDAGLRLEPSAAAGFAAFGPVGSALPVADSTHVIWTTGGSLLPDAEFAKVLEAGAGSTATPMTPQATGDQDG